MNQQDKTQAYYQARIWIARTKKLMEQLLGWECFSSWHAYQQKYQAQEYALGAGQPFTTPAPVAFCEEWLDGSFEWRVFSPDHQDLNVFRPCDCMDDAWVFVQALAKQENVERNGFHTQDIFFARIRSIARRTTIGKTFDDPLTLQEIATLTPLDVCEAVWRAFQHIMEDSDRLPVPKTQNRQPEETGNC